MERDGKSYLTIVKQPTFREDMKRNAFSTLSKDTKLNFLKIPDKGV